MSTAERLDDGLPLKKLTGLVRDLLEPSPAIYWSNLIIGLVLAWGGFLLSKPFPDAFLAGSPLAIASFIVAVFAVYRITYFNHELAHQARKLPGFELVWNLTVGIPLLISSFLYSDHRNHHSLESFGTEDDVEYFRPEMRGMRGVLALVAANFLLPFAYVARFSVMTAAAWANPKIRHWVDTRASSLGILGLAKRAAPTAAEKPSWRWQEAACFVYLAISGILLLTGLLPIWMVVHLYVLFVIVLFLHSLRIMVGHRYDTEKYPQGRVGQILDSFNFTRHPVVNKLMAPLGFDLHALHHLFPNIPFHNMPEAHRRIMAALPSDSPYHAAEAKSFFGEVFNFMMRRPESATTRLGRAPAE